MPSTYYHGGVHGLQPGALLLPTAPHVEDGCPVCVARAQGRALTVGEYRLWLEQFGERARPVLQALSGAADSDPVDPPSARDAVYMTTDLEYARWYAARSRGDLYRVEAVGEVERSGEDRFPTWTAAAARVVQVLERRVRLYRRDRRALTKRWAKLDELAARQRVGGTP